MLVQRLRRWPSIKPTLIRDQYTFMTTESDLQIYRFTNANGSNCIYFASKQLPWLPLTAFSTSVLLCSVHFENTGHRFDVGLMLYRQRRQQANIISILGQRKH